MKKSTVLLATMLLSSQVGANTISDSIHVFGTKVKSIYAEQNDGFGSFIYDPAALIHDVEKCYSNKIMHSYTSQTNPNYEYESPFLGLHHDEVTFRDLESGERYSIFHPQLVHGIDRSKLVSIDEYDYKTMLEAYYNYPVNDPYIFEYVMYNMDCNINNILEYHIYHDIDQIIVYFSNLDKLIIKFDGIQVTEYNYIKK